MKKVLKIALSIIGVVLFIWGTHLSDQAAFAEGRISQAEATGQRRPTLGPVRRGVRTQEAEIKQETLSEKGQTVVASQVTANWLRGIGALLFVIGVGSLIFCRKKN